MAVWRVSASDVGANYLPGRSVAITKQRKCGAYNERLHDCARDNAAPGNATIPFASLFRVGDLMSGALLWGDREQRAAVIGEQIVTRELFRVEAPMPCVWRIMAAHQTFANGAVTVQLFLRTGIGRINEQLTFFVPANTFFTIEVPAQTLSAQFSTDAAVAVENWNFFAIVAPLVPWQGLEVKVVR
jgi:hypothetical protein